MSRKRTSTSDPERVQRIIDFLALGFNDYVGARTLLRASLPIQGATLASTAVEKYAKALMAVRGNSARGHLKQAHFNALQSDWPALWATLNPSFLLFLQRCYQLRYTEDLQPGFNLVAYSREVLAEIDHTVARFQEQLRFTRPPDQVVATSFDNAVQRRMPKLFDDNHVLLKQDRATFLGAPDSASAIRHRGAEGILEVDFTVPHSPTDGDFEREALIPMTEEMLRQKSAEAARNK